MRRRKNLTNEQVELLRKGDSSERRAKILAYGVSEYLKQIYTTEEIKDCIETLHSAMGLLRQREGYYQKAYGRETSKEFTIACEVASSSLGPPPGLFDDDKRETKISKDRRKKETN
jgi:hypothetical protein